MKRSYKHLTFALALALMGTSIPMNYYKVDTKAESVQQAAEIASFDFEGEDTDGWEARGDETVALTSETSHSGSQAVKVTDRTKSWHGVSCDITDLLEDGESYTFKVWVKYDDNSAGYQQNMMLSVATTVNGKESYNNLKSQNVYCGSWALFEGSYTYNSATEIVKMYIEGGTHDFYVDDISIIKNGAQPIQEELVSLKDLFAQYNCKVGTSVIMNEFNTTEKAIINKHFNSLTIGNEMKPDSVLDYNATVAYMEETGDQTTPKISFSKASPILKYCEKNGIEIRGHVLVWHSQTPKWFFTENYSQEQGAKFVSKEVMLKRMENYIKAVFETIKEEYPDLKIYTWDVVNEAIENNGNGYRPAGTEANTSDSLWMKVIGEDFIEAAFTYARKYAPEGTLLAYNDYNEYMTAKTNMMYKICSNLKEKGLIDVIGMQMHLGVDFPSVNMFEAAARKFASIDGIKLEITEFDMTTYDNSKSTLEAQGKKYKAYFDCIKKLMEEGIDFNSITFWGVRDTDSWRASQYPCLFDDKYQAKPAFFGVVGDSVVTSKAPVTTSEAPIVTSEAPIVTSEAPVVTSEAPVVTSEAPIVTSEAPVVTSEAPIVTSEAPVVTTKAPETSQAPVAGPNVSVATNKGGQISQTYTITPAANKSFDVSKLKIRFHYTKDDNSAQTFWCDSAGIQMNKAPYYVAYTSNVNGTFGDGYVDITFDKAFTMDSGSLNLQVRFNNSDWSNYSNLVCGDMEVYYDGVKVQ